MLKGGSGSCLSGEARRSEAPTPVANGREGLLDCLIVCAKQAKSKTHHHPRSCGSASDAASRPE
jgi:hypothetical protein